MKPGQSLTLKQFLSQNKFSLHWMHIGLTLVFTIVIPIFISLFYPVSVGSLFTVGLFALIGYSHNIGLMHEHCHRLPKGPIALTSFTARFMYALGGTGYTRGKLAHTHHHAYLNTDLDPDRLGYLTTKTHLHRYRYLFFIGPLRGIFAPVDTSHATSRMSPESLAKYQREQKKDFRLLLGLHFALLLALQIYYLPVFSALILANVLSNIREMSEHGNDGKAAYVNITVGPIGLLFFSLPGFWYHGHHHMHPQIHYLDLPLKSETLPLKSDIPFLKRKSYVRYLIFGKS